MPPFYRLIGHKGHPQAYLDIAPEEGVVEKIERITGVKVDATYDLGHHSDNQVALYETEVTEENGIPVIRGWRQVEPNEFNPFRYLAEEKITFGKNGERIETSKITNNSDKPIVISRIEHPYTAIPGGEEAFRNSKIFIATEEGIELFYDLSEYERKEISFERYLKDLPLLSEGRWVELHTPLKDGRTRIVKIGFDGKHYNSEHSGMGIFSIGPNEKDLRKDTYDRLTEYYERLRQTRIFLQEAGYSEEEISLPTLEEIDEIETTVQRQVNGNLRITKETPITHYGTSVCIEALTSGGHALRTQSGLAKAIILKPGESATFKRVTEVEFKQ